MQSFPMVYPNTRRQDQYLATCFNHCPPAQVDYLSKNISIIGMFIEIHLLIYMSWE